MLGIYDENPITISAQYVYLLDKAEFLQFWMYALTRAGGIYCDEDFQKAWHEITHHTFPFVENVNVINFTDWILD